MHGLTFIFLAFISTIPISYPHEQESCVHGQLIPFSYPFSPFSHLINPLHSPLMLTTHHTHHHRTHFLSLHFAIYSTGHNPHPHLTTFHPSHTLFTAHHQESIIVMKEKVAYSRFENVCVFYGSSIGERNYYRDVVIELEQETVVKRLYFGHGEGSISLVGIIFWHCSSWWVWWGPDGMGQESDADLLRLHSRQGLPWSIMLMSAQGQ